MTVVGNGVIVDVLLARLGPDQLGEEPLAAPHLLDLEFMHVLRRHNLRGLLTDPQADGLLARFSQLQIDRHPVVPFRARIWELRHNLAAYDAAYVALAEHLETTLLTSDARIARAPGLRCHVDVL